MPKLKPPKLEAVNNVEEDSILEPIPGHPTWSDSISMGLVNIPVRAIPITLERTISFRMLHQKCKYPSPTNFSAKRETRFLRARLPDQIQDEGRSRSGEGEEAKEACG